MRCPTRTPPAMWRTSSYSAGEAPERIRRWSANKALAVERLSSIRDGTRPHWLRSASSNGQHGAPSHIGGGASFRTGDGAHPVEHPCGDAARCRLRSERAPPVEEYPFIQAMDRCDTSTYCLWNRRVVLAMKRCAPVHPPALLHRSDAWCTPAGG